MQSSDRSGSAVRKAYVGHGPCSEVCITSLRGECASEHGETIVVAVPEERQPVRDLGQIPNRAESVRKLIEKLGVPLALPLPLPLPDESASAPTIARATQCPASSPSRRAPPSSPLRR